MADQPSLYQIQDGYIRAARENRLDVMQYLVQHHKCDLTLVLDEFGSNIMHIAAQHSYLDIIKYVHSIAPSLIHQATNELKATPLLIAADHNQFEVVKYLIEHIEASVDVVTRSGSNLLHFAVRYNNIEMIDYFLKINKSFINQSTESGNTPFNEAISNQMCTISQHIINNYEMYIQPTSGLINDMIKYGIDLDFFQRFLNIKDSFIKDPTFELNLNDQNIKMVQFILQQYHQPHHFSVALQQAVKQKQYELIEFCIEFDNTIRSDQMILYAAQINRIDLIQKLLQDPTTNVFVTDTQDRNLMHYAVDSNNQEMIEFVSHLFQTHNSFRSGYPFLTGEWNNRTPHPLENAICSLKYETVRSLIRLKANINLQSTHDTILTHAYQYHRRQQSIFNYFLSDEFLQDWNYQNELQFDDNETIEIYGIKDPIPQLINYQCHNNEHTTPLFIRVITTGQLAHVQLLIERQADVNIVLSKTYKNILHSIIDAATLPPMAGRKNNVSCYDGASILGYLLQQIVDSKIQFNPEYSLSYAYKPCFLSHTNIDGSTPFFAAIDRLLKEFVFNEKFPSVSRTQAFLNGTLYLCPKPSDWSIIQAFVKYTPTIIFQTTDTFRTILHHMVSKNQDQVRYELYDDNLADCIEDVIDIDIDVIINYDDLF